MLIIPKKISDEMTNNIMKILHQHPEGLMIMDISKLIKHNRVTTARYLEIMFYSKQIKLRNIGTAKLYYLNNKEESK